MPNQAQMIAKIVELRDRENELSVKKLFADRQKYGYKHFYEDLKQTTEENPVKGRNWDITKGLLTAKPDFDRAELGAYLDRVFDHKDWWKKWGVPLPAGAKPAMPQGTTAYGFDGKTLGQPGPNEAMDAIIIMRSPVGEIKFKVIEKNIAGVTYMAHIGGMITPTKDGFGSPAQKKEDITRTVVQEFQEEAYSNDTFETADEAYEYLAAKARRQQRALPDKSKVAATSESLLRAKKMAPQQHTAAVEKVLYERGPENTNEFDKLNIIKKELLAIFKGNEAKSLEERLNQFRAALLGPLGASVPVGLGKPLPVEDRMVYWTRFKCRLYQVLLDTAYADMNDFVRQEMKLISEKPLPNMADPRNGDRSWMVSYVHYVLLDESRLSEKEKTWCVKFRGGDDALDGHTYKVEDLYVRPMYSSHGAYSLYALEHIARNNFQALDNDLFEAQLTDIEKNIAAREREFLGATEVAGVLLKPSPSAAASSSSSSSTVPNPVQMLKTSTLVPVSNAANLEQFSRNAAQAEEEPLDLVECVENADNALRVALGQRYAKLANLLEHEQVPASVQVPMSILNKHFGLFVLILDDSSSMDSRDYETTNPETGRRETILRWTEAYRRAREIIRILSYLGVNGEIRFLNREAVHSFNFAPVPGNDAAVDGAYHGVLAFLEQQESTRPSGGTAAYEPITAAMRQQRGEKGVFVTLVTDGGITDKDRTVPFLQNRQNPERTPLTVVACDKATNSAWALDLAKNPKLCIAVFGDYDTVVERLRMMHGMKIPFTRREYSFLHITPRVGEPQASQGFFVYHRALTSEQELKKGELEQLMGRTVLKIEYQLYQKDRSEYRQALLNSNGNYTSAMATMLAPPITPVPPYASIPSSSTLASAPLPDYSNKNGW